MIVPVVGAFSASCSRNGTSAPRPATRAGSSAARVTTGGGALGFTANAGEAVARTPRVRDAAATAAISVRGRVIIDSLRTKGTGGSARSRPNLGASHGKVQCPVVN